MSLHPFRVKLYTYLDLQYISDCCSERHMPDDCDMKKIVRRDIDAAVMQHVLLYLRKKKG